ncbi:hypothetical protein [Paenibacillus massiliensis]|uniref:hypothetical protein n=1 Tax=Paenibacillus massiliensis TaxID=225917 RepID=UPI0012EC4279|nr:hypothetical protein [Paenibacillus massiliensis]
MSSDTFDSGASTSVRHRSKVIFVAMFTTSILVISITRLNVSQQADKKVWRGGSTQ